MNKLNLVCVFAALFNCILAGDVRTLTDNNFQDLISNEPVALVKFFAPWCGHCKSMAPEFEKAATVLKKNDPPVALFEVDCTEAGKDTCGKFGVSGYPTLKIFKNGALTDVYEGPRDADGIVKHMRSKAGPAYRELTTVEEVEKMLTSDLHIVIGFFDEADSASEQWFKAAADAAGSDYTIGYSHSAEVLAKYPYSNKVMVYHPPHLVSKMEDNPRPYTGDLEVASLKSWLEDNAQGMCGHRKISNLDQFKRPLVIVYYDVDYVRNTKGTNYWRNRILKVAKKLREAGKDVTFAVSSATELTDEVESVGLKYDDKPVVAGRNEKDDKFVMTQEFSLEALEQFASDLVDKKLEPYLKSEPIPASNNEPVKVVVGKTFDQIVNDKTKDVLIEFYAPWCGHCKSLAPKYDELAEKLKDEPNIVIAKMDATANDVPQPYNVEGFPTIYFVPKDAKDSPQAYEGEREVKDFLKFIAREASEPLSGWSRDGKKIKAEKEL